MHKRCSVGLIVQVRFYDVLLYSVRDVGSDDGFVDITLADDTIVDIASSADGITTNPGLATPRVPSILLLKRFRSGHIYAEMNCISIGLGNYLCIVYTKALLRLKKLHSQSGTETYSNVSIPILMDALR